MAPVAAAAAVVKKRKAPTVAGAVTKVSITGTAKSKVSVPKLKIGGCVKAELTLSKANREMHYVYVSDGNSITPYCYCNEPCLTNPERHVTSKTGNSFTVAAHFSCAQPENCKYKINLDALEMYHHLTRPTAKAGLASVPLNALQRYFKCAIHPDHGMAAIRLSVGDQLVIRCAYSAGKGSWCNTEMPVAANIKYLRKELLKEANGKIAYKYPFPSFGGDEVQTEDEDDADMEVEEAVASESEAEEKPAEKPVKKAKKPAAKKSKKEKVPAPKSAATVESDGSDSDTDTEASGDEETVENVKAALAAE